MFVGLFQDDMILRLSETRRVEVLKIDGAKIFEPMPGRPMREYVAVPPRVMANKMELHECARIWRILEAEVQQAKETRHQGKATRFLEEKEVKIFAGLPQFIVGPPADSLRGSNGLCAALTHHLVRDGQQISTGNILGFIREL
jgi:hypothetical protein